MKNKKLILAILFFLLFQNISFSQNKKINPLFASLRTVIEKNFHFMEAGDSLQKTDFAIIRIHLNKGLKKIEFADFNNKFNQSLAALIDSIKKKWNPTVSYSLFVYCPLIFILPNDNFKEDDPGIPFVDDAFRKMKSKKENLLWTNPVILIKNERVI